MQIAIDIPEEIYKASQIIDVTYDDVIQIPLECIANGTPLPKGHGRLGDLDKIKQEMQNYYNDCAKTSEYTRVYGLGAMYPDISFSVLTAAFSQALFQILILFVYLLIQIVGS